jgi:hypothetical protein
MWFREDKIDEHSAAAGLFWIASGAYPTARSDASNSTSSSGALAMFTVGR